MYREEYCNKVNIMLSDHKIYKKLKRNSTSSVEKKTATLLKNSSLPAPIIKYLTPRKSSAPRLYGLPKIHKEWVPLRPIVSNIGGATYQLARYLTKPLQKLTGLNDSHIKNSMDFIKKVTKMKTGTNDILFQGEFFEQTSGAAMGSPVSPTIANIFMEYFENEVQKNAPLKPSLP
ncbi:uncharacterized protein LOC112588648 isoform X2 [Harpegnathos saltator]|uniref:uncharacterized protein LOC112588648 isoform X2 n=1 Tax=Harpegnathos saltator TaxID=610380 RepID=UPI000DBEEC71|nr:uncharacterized protein LOC112588648 isoform X2 [Harpegnathos saltator]